MRVLMIEDDQSVRLIYERVGLLWSAHCYPTAFELFLCDNLQAGLRENIDKKPDVVLLDLALVDSRSYDTAKSIHLFTGEPPPAVIVLTGQERPDLVETAFRDGADSYIHKLVGARNQEWLLATIVNADMRRRHRPTYCRQAP